MLSAAVLAHGVTGVGDSFSAFVRSGFLHMITGWDHLLFIAGILLVAREVERAMILLSVFAIGHSATLMTATAAGWQINPGWVDTVIALSLAAIGLVSWLGPPARWRLFGAGVLLLGLVHGLGLASRLQEPARAAHLTPARVIAFNIGVEVAQLFAAAVATLVGLLVRESMQRLMTWSLVWKVVHGALITVGLIGGAVLSAGTAFIRPV
jgi:hydrogenase/urease accessory protein HupE